MSKSVFKSAFFCVEVLCYGFKNRRGIFLIRHWKVFDKPTDSVGHPCELWRMKAVI